jgi:hypothetical protein
MASFQAPLLVQHAEEPPKPHPTEQKIRLFLLREDGWHYGEGVAFRPETVEKAVALHTFILRKGFFRTNAFPGLAGQVIVTLYHRDEYYEFAVLPDGDIEFTQETGNQEIAFREPMTIEEAEKIIAAIRTGTWTSFVSLDANSTTPTEADSKAGLSGTRAAVAESRSLIVNVWSQLVIPCAGTSKSTMLISAETIRSSGACPRTTCLMTAS